LLFFLQPIVRGWARYQGRMVRRTAPLAAQQTLDSVALQQGKQLLTETQYWVVERINRLELVADILRRLNKQGWSNKSDIGWSEYDVEIFGSRWSNLQLTTVAEDHPPNKQMIRCRLTARWSLQAKVAFCVLCALELLGLGFIGERPPWWLWPLLVMPLAIFIWSVRQQERNLRSMIIVFLDEVAKEWRLTKVPNADLQLVSSLKNPKLQEDANS